jgi:hypothetical protein
MAVLLILGMLSAGALAEVPKFGVDEYPKVDGSTAMLPLSYALMMASTGMSEAARRISFRNSINFKQFSFVFEAFRSAE